MAMSVLDRARDELIDLSSRSRLLNVKPEGKANQLRVVREQSSAVYARLVGGGSYFDFLPLDSHAPTDAPVKTDDLADAHLATSLEAEALERRLLRLANDDRTNREETGVSSLFLALGVLRWLDPQANNIARLAPLVLVPVSLERSSAAVPFRLRYTSDELPTNLSLQTKLKRDFAIDLPDAPDGEADDVAASIEAYFDAVRTTVGAKSGWAVECDEIVLGFYSFAKFLMWRDLDPRAWPEGTAERPRPDAHPLVNGLLGRAMPPTKPPLCGDDDPLDALLPPEVTRHVVDADSSQAQVVAEAIAQRRSLVVQGPPGTGKSQTISNVIAAAISSGLRVLFVAEKLAALSVVKTRLDAVGLGAACLELHSTKATRRGVLDDLSRTLDLGVPKDGGAAEAGERLHRAREILASHAARLHRREATSGLTAFDAIGALGQLESKRPFARSFVLDGAEGWTAGDLSERLAKLAALADVAQRIGTADEHAWRGCGLDAVLPSDLAGLPTAIAPLVQSTRELDVVRSAVAGTGLPVTTLADLEVGVALGRLAAQRPLCDRTALASDGWGSGFSRTRALVADLANAANARARLAAVFNDRAFEIDLAPLRDELASKGGAWLKSLMPSWRRADAEYRALYLGVAPKDLAERLKSLDDMIALANLERSVAERDAEGRSAFGSMWSGRATDVSAAGAVIAWFEKILASGVAPEVARSLAGRAEAGASAGLEQHATALRVAIDAVRRFMMAWKIASQRAFGAATVDVIPLDMLSKRIAEWHASPERLRDWIDWNTKARTLTAQGFGQCVAALSSGVSPASEIVDDAQHAYLLAFVRRMDSDGTLTRTDGGELTRSVDTFKTSDEARIRGNRADTAKSHYSRIPQTAQGKGTGLGQVAVILRECAKQRRHMPIRRLLAEAGEAVQAIKPVFMMSPLSVSRFLEPARLAFDVLVVDEASQVRPVEALGAVARLANDATLVVVGDQMQLPPTSFFLGDSSAGDDEDPSEAGSLGDLESLLGACESAGVPRRMLRWHYRSKHHSLIALSNRAFYDNRLNVVPSPSPPDDSLGLRLHRVENAVYDRGGTRTNRAEARAVAEAVMHHATSTPDRSLGVAALSVQQRDAIIDELEVMRKADPSCESFFVEGGAEPFFAKNLENVQGDERDVIFVSIGYGRDKDGGLTMNFGPVSTSGGERRLNVLMTRAKRRCEVFSSISADDIDLERASGAGPKALKDFLAYAGATNRSETLTSTGESSPLERSISDALEAAGFPCDLSVGAPGCIIDVAVRDPRRPGCYALAIETDGPHWNAARAARDRERIRPMVLADRGWHLARVWSVDWWLHRDRELARLLELVKSGLQESSRRVAQPASVAVAAAPMQREAPGAAPAASLTVPYREAVVEVPKKVKPLELDERTFIEIVGKVIEIESPIRLDELAKRVSSLFKVARVSPALSEQVSHAARRLASPEARFAAMDGEFVRLAAQARPTPRNRSDVKSSGLRDPAMLPPAEVVELCVLIAGAHVGVSRDELVVECRRQLGFGATGPRLREILEAALTKAIDARRLVDRAGMLFVAEA